MSSTDSSTSQPTIRAADFQGVDGFIEARTALWNKSRGDLNPSNDVLPALEAMWIREWMQEHADVIGARIRATAGLSFDELTRYTSLGGLKQCVIELHARTTDIATLKQQKRALVDALRSIAEHRHTHAGSQTPEQMLDKVALIAHEAIAYGRPAAREQAPASEPALPVSPAPAIAEPTQPAPGDDVQHEPAPSQPAPDQARVESSPAPVLQETEQHALPLASGMEVFTAQKFMVMAGIRRLSSADGEAYASNGNTYDATRKLDPQEPLPGGLSHVAWKEYVGNL